ncbi:hypothetical protein IFM89_019907 [Coptis chinensis]|uniref:Uncharacterized protein n=1 Tax=Coptis chinensis TaxID=261450 RepID=A0A835I4N4_9MAGN|nr:hypothetical protein IFM89_019907 [Coptis chinensis]
MKERDTGAGLRVKKILRRAPEDESSKLEKLRKEIREAVRNRATKDDGQSKIFDPKLLLAFRNAIAGSRPEREPVRRLNPSFVMSKKSLLQKGKIMRTLQRRFMEIQWKADVHGIEIGKSSSGSIGAGEPLSLKRLRL